MAPRRGRRRGALARRPRCPRQRHRPGPAGRRRRLRDAHQPARRAGPPARACTGPGSTTCSAGTAVWSTRCWRWSTTGRTWPRRSGRRGLPACRGRLRGQPRGCPAPRRRADPAHPDLHRDLRPGRRRRPAGRRADGRRARLGPARLDDEVDHYLRRVEAERQSQLAAHRPGGRRGPGRAPDIV